MTGISSPCIHTLLWQTGSLRFEARSELVWWCFSVQRRDYSRTKIILNSRFVLKHRLQEAPLENTFLKKIFHCFLPNSAVITKRNLKRWHSQSVMAQTFWWISIQGNYHLCVGGVKVRQLKSPLNLYLYCGNHSRNLLMEVFFFFFTCTRCCHLVEKLMNWDPF